MTRTAIIETDGAGALLGVWLADADGIPDVAFTDDTQARMAETILADAATAVDARALTWPEFWASLFDRQNHLTVERWLGQSDAETPQELLAAAAQAAGAYGALLT